MSQANTDQEMVGVSYYIPNKQHRILSQEVLIRT